jgi:murein DD-endopeptidase MepM/ murein hydrolase activator NlpD
MYQEDYTCPAAAGTTPPDCGNRVQIRCTGGPVVELCHLQEITHAIGSFNRGDLIGYSDNTGNSCENNCTPHLHFEMNPANTDPQRFWDVSCLTGPSGIRDLTSAEQERCRCDQELQQ